MGARACRPQLDTTERERLRQYPTAALPPAQAEIFAFLTNPRLDTMRARMLEREFFGT
jgi:hypothetical protein